MFIRVKKMIITKLLIQFDSHIVLRLCKQGSHFFLSRNSLTFRVFRLFSRISFPGPSSINLMCLSLQIKFSNQARKSLSIDILSIYENKLPFLYLTWIFFKKFFLIDQKFPDFFPNFLKKMFNFLTGTTFLVFLCLWDSCVHFKLSILCYSESLLFFSHSVQTDAFKAQRWVTQLL